ncbi:MULTISPECIES: DUF6957 family protein [Pseudomonas]|uniref:DUF6957 family protein n=1 Tax=Pseudomonas TaxID=286 RepID=UPI00067648BF|nr:MULTISPECIES: hypothetical protein [Pseudomonas]MCK2124795.1 hypothetical protein [Pseudomonas sp. PNPG3]QUN70422.1 hypothetical protein KDB76_14630 [Pseudomonas sp. JS425]
MEQHLISDILHGPALVIGGSGLSDSEAIKAASEEFSGVRFYVVRQWMLLDVVVSAEWERHLEGLAHMPTVLYAHAVVHDSAGQLEAGSSFLTGPALESKDCFFACGQGLFVLAGSGARKKISLPALLALSNAVGTTSLIDRAHIRNDPAIVAASKSVAFTKP